MEWLKTFADYFIHLDHHINSVVEHYGAWTYLILFLIIFCETGLVVTPFLPGDSLLFVVGALSASGGPLKIQWIVSLLITAAVLGDNLNYLVGHLLAPRVFRHEHIRFVKREYLERTEQFYAKYGAKAIIIARFAPILRTFAPFLAGVGSMRYPRFLGYDIIGGTLWIGSMTLGGYFFGNLPVVRRNFTLVIFAIIFISLLPAIIEFIRSRSQKSNLSS